MRAAEIVMMVVVGLLLLGIGYELGKSRSEPHSSKLTQQEIDKLEERIRAGVEAEVARKQSEMLEPLVAKVEKLLSEPMQAPELKPAPTGESPDDQNVKRLEGELDRLLAAKMAESGEPAGNETSTGRRRREPFDPLTLKRYEEARRRMLEELRRKQQGK